MKTYVNAFTFDKYEGNSVESLNASVDEDVKMGDMVYLDAGKVKLVDDNGSPTTIYIASEEADAAASGLGAYRVRDTDILHGTLARNTYTASSVGEGLGIYDEDNQYFSELETNEPFILLNVDEDNVKITTDVLTDGVTAAGGSCSLVAGDKFSITATVGTKILGDVVYVCAQTLATAAVSADIDIYVCTAPCTARLKV